MSVSDITRNLVSRLPQHPESARMRVVIQETLAVAEKFEAKRRELESKGHLTPHGRREALKEALTKQFARDLRDAQKPISEARERLRTMKSAVKVKPSADPNNVVAALERQELRATIAEMPEAERIGFVLGTSDPRILEAVLGQPAVVSGIPEEVFAKVESAYQERRFAKELHEIRELETVVVEAEAAARVARDELRQTIDLDPRAFDAIVKPIEEKRSAPWLIKDGEKIRVVKPGQHHYPEASADEIRDGVYYRDVEEYQAATKGTAQAA